MVVGGRGGGNVNCSLLISDWSGKYYEKDIFLKGIGGGGSSPKNLDFLGFNICYRCRDHYMYPEFQAHFFFF